MPEINYKEKAMEAENSIREYATVFPVELIGLHSEKVVKNYTEWTVAMIEHSYHYLGFAIMNYLQAKGYLPVEKSPDSLRCLLQTNAPDSWKELPSELRDYIQSIDKAHAIVRETARPPRQLPWSQTVLPVWCTRLIRCVKENLLI